MSNFVFVHAGMIGGICWKKIRKPLEEKKCVVLTPTLTGLSERRHLTHQNIDLATHIQDVLNTIFYEELEDIILVGHSYGGMVITGVADKIPNKIRKLIYIAAVLPMNGESMFDAVGPEITAFLYKSAQNGNGWEVPAGMPETYGIEAPEDKKWFKKLSTPHPIKSFQYKLNYDSSSFEKLDKIYIKCSHDLALEPMAKRAKDMKIPCYEIDAGHFPMITHPEIVIDLLTNHDNLFKKKENKANRHSPFDMQSNDLARPR